MHDNINRIIKKRTSYFHASAFTYIATLLCIIIIIPVTIETKEFFTVLNKSNYVEVANLFSKVDVFLRGHRVTFIDSRQWWNLKPFYALFYTSPDYTRVPDKFTPDDLVPFLQNIPTQNPFVYVPLLFAELIAITSLVLGILAYKKTSRRSVIYAIISSTLLIVILSLSTGIGNKIYNEIIPNALNKSITIEVQRNEQLVTITGRLKDVGIRFISGSGLNYLISIIVLNVFTIGASIRWIFESNVPRENPEFSSRIRNLYF